MDTNGLFRFDPGKILINFDRFVIEKDQNKFQKILTVDPRIEIVLLYKRDFSSYPFS